LSSREVDVVLLQGPLLDEALESSTTFVDAIISVTAPGAKPVIFGSVDDGRVGTWARELSERGVIVGRGIRATARGLRTMGDFVRYRRNLSAAPAHVPSISKPTAVLVETSSGPMLPFESVMTLLSQSGVRVAPYCIIEGNEAIPGVDTIGFDGPYVVKLADVPHRTDIGAVAVGVAVSGLEGAIESMRRVAHQTGSPDRVVLQPHVIIHGEAFLGIQAQSDLGPLVLFGVGGIFIELLNRVSGGLAPLRASDARAMLDAMSDTGVFAGARGLRAWDRDDLAELLMALGRLAAGAAEWMDSLDINPLALTADGFVALDGLCFVRAAG
jgi:acyl-CoA synthetase (NDP forming)